MNKMPYKIKEKLRQLSKAYEKAGQLELQVSNMIEEYGVNCEYLNANIGYTTKPTTEALAYIINSEGGTESSIEEIEEVFLWHVNNKEE